MVKIGENEEKNLNKTIRRQAEMVGRLQARISMGQFEGLLWEKWPGICEAGSLALEITNRPCYLWSSEWAIVRSGEPPAGSNGGLEHQLVA
jgi:hypothetical protein